MTILHFTSSAFNLDAVAARHPDALKFRFPPRHPGVIEVEATADVDLDDLRESLTSLSTDLAWVDISATAFPTRTAATPPIAAPSRRRLPSLRDAALAISLALHLVQAVA